MSTQKKKAEAFRAEPSKMAVPKQDLKSMFKKQETRQKKAADKPAKKKPQQKLSFAKPSKRKAPEADKPAPKLAKKPKAVVSKEEKVVQKPEKKVEEEVRKVSKKVDSLNLYTKEEDVDEEMPPSNLGSKRVTQKGKVIDDSSDDEVLAPDSQMPKDEEMKPVEAPVVAKKEAKKEPVSGAMDAFMK